MTSVRIIKTKKSKDNVENESLPCTFAIVKPESSEHYCIKRMTFVSRDNAIELMNANQASYIHDTLYFYDRKESKIVNLNL
jgi:hypothetical protein